MKNVFWCCGFQWQILVQFEGGKIQTFQVQQKISRMIFVSPENNFVSWVKTEKKIKWSVPYQTNVFKFVHVSGVKHHQTNKQLNV